MIIDWQSFSESKRKIKERFVLGPSSVYMNLIKLKKSHFRRMESLEHRHRDRCAVGRISSSEITEA